MRILHLNERWAGGGAETYVRGLCAAQRERGDDVRVLVAETGGDDAIEGVELEIIARRVRVRRAQVGLGPLAHAVQAFRPQAIHLHNVLRLLNPWALRELDRIAPVVWTIHDLELIQPLRRPSIGYAWKLKQWRRSAGVLRLIVPSRFARRQLERAGLASEVIAPFGQPLYLGPPAEPHTLLFLGGGRREKGANELAEALELLDRRGLEWRAIVAGVRLEGRQPFDRLDRERVELHGPARAAEVRSMLARASIAVFPSRLPETFGYAGFEALCAGRPVVAYDSGAVTEWLRPGESGLLAQAGAPASLAEALAELLLDPSRARALGEAGRRQIAENHRRDRHLAELDRIYARGRAG